MDLEKLDKANCLQQTLHALKAIIAGIERLLGLSETQRGDVKAKLQEHHDDVQKQLDEL